MRRGPGLQVWLVAILIAVGALASLAVVLSIVPTFQSSLRDARASATARELNAELADQVANQHDANDLANRVGSNQAANQIAGNVQAQVRITEYGTSVVSARSSGCCASLDPCTASLGCAHLASIGSPTAAVSSTHQ